MVSEDVIRKLTLEAIEQLGANATTANVQRVVKQAVEKLEQRADGAVPNASSDSGRIILTAYGYNAPGIIASITEILARHRCDILDMTQKLLQEFFSLMMIVDITNSPSAFLQLSEELSALSQRMGIRILVQHEEIFNAMHRI